MHSQELGAALSPGHVEGFQLSEALPLAGGQAACSPTRMVLSPILSIYGGTSGREMLPVGCRSRSDLRGGTATFLKEQRRSGKGRVTGGRLVTRPRTRSGAGQQPRDVPAGGEGAKRVLGKGREGVREEQGIAATPNMGAVQPKHVYVCTHTHTSLSQHSLARTMSAGLTHPPAEDPRSGSTSLRAHAAGGAGTRLGPLLGM